MKKEQIVAYDEIYSSLSLIISVSSYISESDDNELAVLMDLFNARAGDALSGLKKLRVTSL